MDAISLGAFIVLLGSYGLILWLRRVHRGRKVESFLFEGNRPLLAVSSGIGAMFSYSLAGTALLSAGYVFGWQVCGPIMFGAILGLLTYIRLINRPSILKVTANFRSRRFAEGASYPQAIAEESGKQVHFVILSYLLLTYIAMLVSEIAVIRVTLQTLLGDANLEAELLILLLLFVCFAYVYAGGFLGILVSDHAQLIVIILFAFSILIDIDWLAVWQALPGPTEAETQTRGFLRVALLASSFLGSYSIVLGYADHWYRTAGTLPQAQARRVLIIVTATTTLLGCGLIVVGSAAHNLTTLKPTLGYDLSLRLLAEHSAKLNSTSLVFLGMTLTAIALTTIDTYIITLKQIYYEISIHLHADRHRWYMLEYIFKRRAIRVVGALGVLISLGLSFLIPQTGIYAWGTVALGAIILVVPLLVFRALELNCSYQWQPQVLGLTLSLVAVPAVYFALRQCVWAMGEDPFDHLYLLVLSLGGGTIVGYGLSFLVWRSKEVR